MTDIHHIPLDQIAADAFPRDRTVTDPDALAELLTSINRDGLRQPIELCGLEDPDTPYGLISGYRRLTVFRDLRDNYPGGDRFAAIPAFLRNPADSTAALRLMIEENAVRADIAPWDQGRIAVEARDQGLFDTLDAAIDGLYAAASRQKRAKLRNIAQLVELMSGILRDPEHLTQRQCLRLATACQNGYAKLIEHTALLYRHDTGGVQMRALQNILLEAETEARTTYSESYPPGRPRRLVKFRDQLTIRRERRPEGWCLHFTGDEARGGLMEDIMDEVERLFGTHN